MMRNLLNTMNKVSAGSASVQRTWILTSGLLGAHSFPTCAHTCVHTFAVAAVSVASYVEFLVINSDNGATDRLRKAAKAERTKTAGKF